MRRPRPLQTLDQVSAAVTGSRIPTFDWCQDQRPYLTLNDCNVLCCNFKFLNTPIFYAHRSGHIEPSVVYFHDAAVTPIPKIEEMAL